MYAPCADGPETEGTHGNIQVKIALACKRRMQTISYGRRIRRRLHANINIASGCMRCMRIISDGRCIRMSPTSGEACESMHALCMRMVRDGIA